MATKTASQRAKITKAAASRRSGSALSKLHKLIGKHEALGKDLQNLMEELEDAEDGRRLDAAIKQNAGKPGIPWAEAKKRLGLA